MQRRKFMALLSGAIVWRHAAYAQQSERMRRIGVLMPYPPANKEFQEHVRAFREELRKLTRSSTSAGPATTWTSFGSAASNLVELNPDVILAIGGRVLPILMGLTRSIPIVVPGGSDPVRQGYAESLAHPGSNVTGFATMESSVIGKMLQILKEIAPHVTRVFIIYNP